MTLQQLEYVLALAKFRHFAKAADYCKVTQPTLSSMVQKLEEELGIKIFDRRRQPILPTKAVLMSSVMREVLRQARRLRGAAENSRRLPLGNVHLRCTAYHCPYLIPRFSHQMLGDYRHGCQIIEMKTSDMKKALQEQIIIDAVLARVDGLDDLKLSTLYYEQFYAYVSKDDPLFPKSSVKVTDLKSEFLWLLDEGSLLPRSARQVLSASGRDGKQKDLPAGKY